MDIKTLREQVDRLFSRRSSYVLLLQELAEQFYPERADFTVMRTVGDNWADFLTSSYPVVVRRELGNAIGQMLRPTAKEWFHIVPIDKKRETTASKQWLQMVEEMMRRAMYDPVALFERSMTQADHDYATFGGCVTTTELGRERDRLLFRTYHIRDIVWLEDEEGQISLVARKWKPKSWELQRYFKKLHEAVGQEASKDAFAEQEVYHICVKSELYDGDAKRMPWFSIYYDVKHQFVMEEVPYWRCKYDVSRWQLVSGSQYPYSPAAITALPEARLIQAMTYTLLEAGEKATNPPLIATEEAVKSNVEIFAGGITWVDIDYDERMGTALRPIDQDLKGLPIGQELLADSRQILGHCFFLNKLNLPERGKEMTAYEVGQRVQEYIRGALPIFSPMEQERNAKHCESVFHIMLREGAFGPVNTWPTELQGAEVQFQFSSPLHDIIEQQKGQKFLEAKTLLREAYDLDPGAVALIDVPKALRDALHGIQVSADWIRGEDEVREIAAEHAAQRALPQTVETANVGAQALEHFSKVAENTGQPMMPAG